MVLSNVFERFAKGGDGTRADGARFGAEGAGHSVPQAAKRQYEKELFSSLVDLMALVVCGAHPSVHTADRAMREQLPVTLTALFAKLIGVEVGTSEALVVDSAERLRPVMRVPPRSPSSAYFRKNRHRMRYAELKGECPKFCVV